MNELSNRSRLPGAQVLWPLAALVAFLTALVVEELPSLRTSRPDATPQAVPLLAPEGVRSAPAKMWEDPFAVLPRLGEVDRKRVVSAARELFAKVIEESTRARDGSPEQQLLALPVLVPGQPFENAVEDRIRTRYAVVSALQSMGFKLSYPDRMTVTYVSVAATLVRGETTRSEIPIPVKVFTRDRGETPRSDSDIGAVLVLWINESFLEKSPLHTLAQILDGTLGDVKDTSPKKLRLAVIGPFSSDTLADMLREDVASTTVSEATTAHPPSTTREVFSREAWAAWIAPFCRRPEPNPLTWFRTRFAEPLLLMSPRATVPLEYLDLPVRAGEPLEGLRARKALATGFRLVQTIGTDRQLALALSRELRLRGAWPRDLGASVNSDRHVVLVYEQDSLYGRAFGRSLRNFIPRSNLHLFGYRRGLDGRTLEARSKRNEESKNDTNTTRSDDLPEGPAQIDYLRRIADEVARHHGFLHDSGQGSIVAVGIVGTDIFDKLLILRALRHHLPKARFFTTDLDARLWHVNEYPYTRNVVVASHFGLGLNRNLRFDAPPFRDSYQTSVFLATLRALGSFDIERVFTSERTGSTRTAQAPALGRWDPWGRGYHAEESVLQPLVFEISRMGPYRFATTELESKVSHDLQADRPGHAAGRKLLLSVLVVVTLLAVLAYYYRSIESAFRAAYTALYLVTPLFIRKALKLSPPRQSSERSADSDRPARWPTAFLLTFIMLAAIFGIILVDHNRVGGEPFTLTAGISVWPSVILRVLCITVSVGLLWLCSRKLRALKKAYPEPPHTALVGNTVDKLLERGRWLKRLAQTGLYYLFGILLFVVTDTYPGTPFRGAVSYVVTVVVTLISVFLVLLLTCFVLDCLAKTRRVVNSWIDELTREHLRDRQHRDVGEVASRYIRDFAAFSDLIGHFVYYPFVVVLLLSASRISFFDNWDMPWTLYAVMSLILCGVVVEVVRLRLTASRLRRYAVARLTDSLDRALTTGVKRGIIEAQRLRIARINEERRGAFRPFVEDPIVIAAAIPFGGTGSLILLERMVSGG